MNVGQAGAPAGTAWAERAAWVVALAAVAALLAFSRYESRDPDSALYAAISADLTVRPLAAWIAPEWNGHWGLDDLYREHPAGMFVLPALLARLGYPALQAAYLVNAGYQILTLLLVVAIAREFLPRRDARLLATILLLLPIAFTYRVRANQEQPLLLALAATLYGIERSRVSLKWAALSTAGLAGLFLVKGVFVAVALAAVAGWLLVGEWRWPSRPGRARSWAALAIGVAGLAALALAYDAAYARATGEPFFPWYLARQFGVASAASTAPPAKGALNSLTWYVGRIAWYTAPWIVVAAVGVWQSTAMRRKGQGGGDRDRAAEARVRGAVLCAVVAGIYLLAFSAYQRRADRYIFPAYFILGAWWAAYGLRLIPAVRRAAWRATRALYPYDQAVIWLGLVMIAVLSAAFKLPNIKIWR